MLLYKCSYTFIIISYVSFYLRTFHIYIEIFLFNISILTTIDGKWIEMHAFPQICIYDWILLLLLWFQ